MIEMENIKKNYTLNGAEVPILKGISLFVGQGEFVSIMGPSGSGKSTLSAILGCLSTPSEGTYKINGQDVTKLKSNQVASLRSQSIGFIFQDFNLLNGISAMENVALPLVYAGVGSKERKQRALDCLKAVGLELKSKNRPDQLSGGQKQRVAIARALVNNPKFLFADEPTGALDKKTGHEIMGIMQKLNLQGHTVIQVTHSPADANYSKRILHLVDGNIIRDEMVEKPTIAIAGQTENTDLSELVSKVWRIAQISPTTNPADFESLRTLFTLSSTRTARIAAARAVFRWNNPAVDRFVQELLSTDDWVVRAEVLKFVGLRGRENAIRLYVEALSDPNAWVRHVAMSELKEIDQEIIPLDAQSRVLSMFEDKDERVRASAIFLVGKWNVPDAEARLSHALFDTDGRVRANAVEAIKAHGLEKEMSGKILPLLNDRSNRVRANAALILSKIDLSVSVDTAQKMLNAPDPLTRSSGAWLVGELQPENGGTQLLGLMAAEKDDIVINQIIKSLGKLAKERYPLHQQIATLFGTT